MPSRSKRAARPIELRGYGVLTGSRTLISGFADLCPVHLGDKDMVLRVVFGTTTPWSSAMRSTSELPQHFGPRTGSRTLVFELKARLPAVNRYGDWCQEQDLNLHASQAPVLKTGAFSVSAILALVSAKGVGPFLPTF
jgi:hypothetical protein